MAVFMPLAPLGLKKTNPNPWVKKETATQRGEDFELTETEPSS